MRPYILLRIILPRLLFTLTAAPYFALFLQLIRQQFDNYSHGRNRIVSYDYFILRMLSYGSFQCSGHSFKDICRLYHLNRPTHKLFVFYINQRQISQSGIGERTDSRRYQTAATFGESEEIVNNILQCRTIYTVCLITVNFIDHNVPFLQILRQIFHQPW